MGNFRTLSAAAASAGLAALGEPVAYTPAGGSAVTVQAVIEHNVVPVDTYTGEIGEPRSEGEFLLSDLASAARGDQVTVDGVDYTLADRLEDDGVMVKWGLRRA